MSRSVFLLITAIGSFCFGALMFISPTFTSILLGITPDLEIISVLRGMGGLIIGVGVLNFLLKPVSCYDVF
jgi:hypothetical protein